MTLRSKQLEKALRARIKDALCGDPQLRGQARRAPKAPWLARPWAKVSARILFSCLLPALIAVMHQTGWPPATQSAVAALWFGFGALMLRFRVLSVSYDLHTLTALALLPASNELVLRFQRARALRQVWRPLCDALAMLIVIAAFHDAGAGAWLAMLPMALLAAVAVLAMSFWLTFVPMPGLMVCLPYVAFLVIVVLARTKVWGDWLLPLFIKHCETISLLSPGGWMARAYLGFLAGDLTVAIPLLTLSGVAATSLALALKRWERIYLPDSFALWHSFGEPPAEWKPALDAQLERLTATPDQADGSGAILTREFLEPTWPNTETGWVDRRVALWLTRRERAIVEFAGMKPPNWAREIKWGAALVGVGLGICWFAKRAGLGGLEVTLFFIGGIAALIGCGLGLPLATPFTRAFSPVTIYGVSIPFVAVFPITPRELMIIALKAAVVRALAFAPVMAMGGAVLGHILGLNPITTALWGLKCAVIAVFAVPWLQVMNHSAGANDSTRFSTKTLKALVVVLGGFLGLATGGVAAVFAPAPWWILGFVLAAASSFGSAKLYMDMHALLWFDLARAAQEY
ncbi:MAG: hypothetical protein N2379_06535 [Verrucomicrobiae bacterium]|nr:hypothetical protein [Verrucomicrobiae bacterium]